MTTPRVSQEKCKCICCLSVTENLRIFHMSIHDKQSFPAKYENIAGKEAG